MKLPTTPEEIIAFIGSQYISMQTETPDGRALLPDHVRYDLTIHDLLSAFESLAVGQESESSGDIERAYIALSVDGVRPSSLTEGIAALRLPQGATLYAERVN